MPRPLPPVGDDRYLCETPEQLGLRQDANPRHVSMPCLGEMGRWGNTVLQYLFAKSFSKENGMELLTPSWIGKSIFGLQEDEVTGHPQTLLLDGISKIVTEGPAKLFPCDFLEDRAQSLREGGREAVLIKDEDNIYRPPMMSVRDIELEGLFLVNSRHLAPHKNSLQSALTLIPEVQQSLEPCLSSLRSRGRTIIGIHIRRGDYVDSLSDQGFQMVLPIANYLTWLKSAWALFNDPVLYLATDDPSITSSFASYSPITADSLQCNLAYRTPAMPPRQFQRDLQFLPDWYVLANCDVLIVANSSFSFSAALMNQAARLFLRPTFDGQFMEFCPWNSEPLLFRQPSNSLPKELMRRVVSDVKATTVCRAPILVARALTLFRHAISTRIRCIFRTVGWRRAMRELFRPKTYLSFAFKLDANKPSPSRRK